MKRNRGDEEGMSFVRVATPSILPIMESWGISDHELKINRDPVTLSIGFKGIFQRKEKVLREGEIIRYWLTY